MVLSSAFNGTQHLSLHLLWPSQELPSNSDWQIWWKILAFDFLSYRHSRWWCVSLGYWNNYSKVHHRLWKGFFDFSVNKVYVRHKTMWSAHTIVPLSCHPGEVFVHHTPVDEQQHLDLSPVTFDPVDLTSFSTRTFLQVIAEPSSYLKCMDWIDILTHHSDAYGNFPWIHSKYKKIKW